MRWLKIRILRWLGLVEPCPLIGDDLWSHREREPSEGCILCYQRGWVPTRAMIQASFQAMAIDAQDHVHPYDSWDAAQQVVDMALGDWTEEEGWAHAG